MNTEGKIAKKLWEHRVLHGREIRIPGGKCRNESEHYACFGLIYKDGVYGPEILVVPYDPGKEKLSLKDDEERYPEDPKGTLERELLEETGVIPIKYNLLGSLEVKNNRSSDAGAVHIKYGWAVKEFDASNLRKEPSPSGRIQAPLWVPLYLLKSEIWPHHRWMLGLFEEYYKSPKTFQSQVIKMQDFKVQEPAA